MTEHMTAVNRAFALIAVISTLYTPFSHAAYIDEREALKRAVEAEQGGDIGNAVAALAPIHHPQLVAAEFFYLKKAQLLKAAAASAAEQDRVPYLEEAVQNLRWALDRFENGRYRRIAEKDFVSTLRTLFQLEIARKNDFIAIRYFQELNRLNGVEDQDIYGVVKAFLNTKQLGIARSIIGHYQKLFSTIPTSAGFTNNQKRFIHDTLAHFAQGQQPKTTNGSSPSVKRPTLPSETTIRRDFKRISKEIEEKPWAFEHKDLARRLFVAWKHEAAKGKRLFDPADLVGDWPASLLYFLVDPLWDNGYFKEALSLNETLIDEAEGLDAYPRLWYVQGRLLQDTGRYDEAAKWFDRYVEKAPFGPYYEACLFHVAWSYYQSGREDRALKGIEAYLAAFPDGGHSVGLQYYRIQLIRKKKGDWRTLAKQLTETYPTHYYTLMARADLGEKDSFDPTSWLQDPSARETWLARYKDGLPMSPTDQFRLKKIEELQYVGLKEAATSLLMDFHFDEKNPELMFYLTRLFQDLQKVPQQVTFTTRLIYAAQNFRQLIDLKEIYPPLFRDLVDARLQKLNSELSPWYVVSLMRQESAFQTDALSPAGATGLMQLMEGTARRTARDANIAFNRQKLIDPAYNISLGTHLLWDLIRRYEGRVDYALAAYNAGPNALNRWVKARGALPPADFIEAIPYKETRIYVQTILRNLSLYHALYQGKSLPPLAYVQPRTINGETVKVQ